MICQRYVTAMLQKQLRAFQRNLIVIKLHSKVERRLPLQVYKSAINLSSGRWQQLL